MDSPTWTVAQLLLHGTANQKPHLRHFTLQDGVQPLTPRNTCHTLSQAKSAGLLFLPLFSAHDCESL